MTIQTKEQLTSDERTIIDILRKLPRERVWQVVDFARFIQSRTAEEHEETEEEIRLSEEKWEHLFAKPAAQDAMLTMAYEALAEEDAGLTEEMSFDEEGNLVEAQ